MFHCTGEDSIEHRALVCPHYGSVRRAFLDCVDLWHAFPVSMTLADPGRIRLQLAEQVKEKPHRKPRKP